MRRRILLGPPGTGKTHSLIELVKTELASGTPPDRIGYVSFTRKAHEEAAGRAKEAFPEIGTFPYFRTIHSLCFRLLGLQKTDVVQLEHLKKFGELAKVKISGRIAEDGLMASQDLGDRILFMENLARTRGISLAEQFRRDDDQLSWDVVDRVTRDYNAWKHDEGLMDFTDMLLQFTHSGIEPRLDVLFVDEAQDLSWLQWQVVGMLSRLVRIVVVAGDDDQAIYRWSGADTDYLINLDGEVTVLDQSYRVPPSVQLLSNVLLPHMGRRREKIWNAKRGGDGSVTYLPTFRQVDLQPKLAATGSKDQSVLILSRNTYVLREQVEPELRRLGLVYERGSGFPSFRWSVVNAIRTWQDLRAPELGVEPEDKLTVRRARGMYQFLEVGRGVERGFKSLSKFTDDDAVVTMELLRQEGGLLAAGEWSQALTLVPRDEGEYLSRCSSRWRSEGWTGDKIPLSRDSRGWKPRVRLSTIHGSKGGEAERVVLLKEMAGRTYQEMQLNREDEARVWYVGATRAAEDLVVVESQTSRACPWL